MSNETKLLIPFWQYICLRSGCGKIFAPDLAPFDEGDWSQLNQARLTELLLAEGWVIHEWGYTFCSLECASKNAIENDEMVRRIQARIEQVTGIRLSGERDTSSA